MPRQLGHSVERIARASLGKDWGLYAALLQHWQEIVGQDYARVTTPVKMVFPHQPNEAKRRNGTLTIRLPKGLAMEFTYKTDIIRQRINHYFGYDAVAKIAFDTVYRLPSKKPAAEADPQELAQVRDMAQGVEVEGQDLRDALQSFGEAMVKRPRETI